jgi:hypothetical protein
MKKNSLFKLSNHFILFLIINLLFIFSPYSILSQQNSSETFAKITFFSGNGKVIKTKVNKEYNLELNQLIDKDDTIQTFKESKVEITIIEKGTVITIYENSKLSISNILNQYNDKTTLINLFYGKIKLIVSKLTGKEEFIVNTPTGIASVRGTEFEVAASDLGDSLIKVNEGKVEVFDDDEKYSIYTNENESTYIEFSKKPTKVDDPLIKDTDNFLNYKNIYSAQIAKIRLKLIFTFLNNLDKNLKLIEKRIDEIYNNKFFQKIIELRREGKMLGSIELGYLQTFRNILSQINYLSFKNIYKAKILYELINNLISKAELTEKEKNEYIKSLKNFNNNIQRIFTKLLIINKYLE